MKRGGLPCAPRVVGVLALAAAAALALLVVLSGGVGAALSGGGGFVSARGARAASAAGGAAPRDAAATAAAAADLDEEAREAAVRAELGRGTWQLLHRMAAQYDAAPSAEAQARARAFFSSFAALYPCKVCAGHFRGVIAADPPDVSSNAALSLWLCRVHNVVNARLRKPRFACELPALAERWGECGCFGNATAAAAGGASGADGGLRGPRRRRRRQQAPPSIEEAWGGAAPGGAE